MQYSKTGCDAYSLSYCKRSPEWELYGSFMGSLFCHQESIEPDPAHYFPYDKSAERKKREKEEKEGREKGEERIVEELCVA